MCNCNSNINFERFQTQDFSGFLTHSSTHGNEKTMGIAYTMWNSYEFSITHILREINFVICPVCIWSHFPATQIWWNQLWLISEGKNCYFTILEAFNFDFFEKFTLENVKNYQKLKIQTFKNSFKGQFLGLHSDQNWFHVKYEWPTK